MSLHDPDAPVNLWQPADRSEDFGAHGVFDDKSIRRDPQLWASRHHGVLAGAASGLAALGAAAALLRRHR